MITQHPPQPPRIARLSPAPHTTEPTGPASAEQDALPVDALSLLHPHPLVVVYDLTTVEHPPGQVYELVDLETVAPPETWARVHEGDSGLENVRANARVAETV